MAPVFFSWGTLKSQPIKSLSSAIARSVSGILFSSILNDQRKHISLKLLLVGRPSHLNSLDSLITHLHDELLAHQLKSAFHQKHNICNAADQVLSLLPQTGYTGSECTLADARPINLHLCPKQQLTINCFPYIEFDYTIAYVKIQ